MRTIRYLLAALCLVTAVHANAFEVGQLTTGSRLDERLAARIELYGLDAAAAASAVLELKPVIGPAAAPAAVADLRATIANDGAGQAYVALTSLGPVRESMLEFRLRAQVGDTTRIQHYSLALAAPLVRPAAVAPSRTSRPARSAPETSHTALNAAPALPPATAAPDADAARQYGPVQAGQSLWQILAQNGLARGDTAGTMSRVVADNPHAFVGGNADKLKVGVTLTLPASATAATPAAVASAPVQTVAVSAASAPPASIPAPAPRALVPTAPALDATDAADTTTAQSVASVSASAAVAVTRDAETTARLAALEQKFAAIRARYAAQGAATAATVVVAPAARTASTDDTAAPPPAVVSAASAAAPSQRAPAALLSLASTALLAVLALLVVAAGAFALRRTHGHRRRRHDHAAVVSSDRHLMQQIAAKAEKRVQLEDDMRTLRNRNELDRQDAVPPAPANAKLALVTPPNDFSSTIERLADLETSTAGFEEIETRIAYGQYGEAERLLRGVLVKAPYNHRAKLRLAEIYYLDERHDQFVALAGEIHRLHRADIDDDDWQRIMRMGKVIAPEQPPFSGPLAIDGQRDAS